MLGANLGAIRSPAFCQAAAFSVQTVRLSADLVCAYLVHGVVFEFEGGAGYVNYVGRLVTDVQYTLNTKTQRDQFVLWVWLRGCGYDTTTCVATTHMPRHHP